MVTPLSLLGRLSRSPARLAPPVGRCMVCAEPIRDPGSMLTLRGGLHVHNACATYRIRQRARTH